MFTTAPSPLPRSTRNFLVTGVGLAILLASPGAARAVPRHFAINSTPPGAQIYVSDGLTPAGKTPCVVDVDSAANATETGLRLRMEGYQDLGVTVPISSGENVRLIANLIPEGTARSYHRPDKAKMRGYNDQAVAVAYSPDGRTIATGCDDESVRLYEAASGKLLKTLTGHSNSVGCVAFSPDGSLLASGSRDKNVRIWKVDSGECLHVLKGHDAKVSAIAFSPDGTLLASGSMDNTAKIWAVESGEVKLTCSGHTDNVASVVFSPDGSRLLTGSWDQTMKVWDAKSAECLKTVAGHDAYVRSVLWYRGSLVTFRGRKALAPLEPTLSPAPASVLASSADDNTIKLWDAETGQLFAILAGHNCQIISLSVSPDGKTLAGGGDDGTVKLWDLNTGKLKKSIGGHKGDVFSVAFSPDGDLVLSGGRDKLVQQWSLSAGEARTSINTRN